MCCMLTWCGWMIDMFQRIWTFSMSCLIMTAIVAVFTTVSMAGIALGYNYSLAEFIDLKETNVSVYLKRGVMGGDVDAGGMHGRRAGNINDENLMTGAPADEVSSLRSGRRLDDSVFDADDHHKYEGSLMKLTAKPLHLQPRTDLTTDADIAPLTNYRTGSLDQMKAIQSLIDSRRAMATAGSTISLLAPYASAPFAPFSFPSENNPNVLAMYPLDQYRRMMLPPQGDLAPPINPARLAVPSIEDVIDRSKWLLPKYPNYFLPTKLDGHFRSSLTYPTAVTVRPMLLRPKVTENNDVPPPGAVMFPYFTSTTKGETTQPIPLRKSGQDQSDLDRRPDFYNEKFLIEGDELSKSDKVYKKMSESRESGRKSPEEEYEDEIKGLPVRRRRSIVASTHVGEGRNPTERNSKHTRKNGNKNSVKNIFTSLTTSKEIDSNYEDIFTINKNINIIEVSNDSKTAIKISHKDTIQQMDASENGTFDLENKLEINRENDRNENEKGQSLLEHLVETKEASLVAETAPNAAKSSAEDMRINTKISSFESKILPTKYVSNNLATRLKERQPFNNKGIFNKEEVLLRNHASSKFVNVLQSIFTR